MEAKEYLKRIKLLDIKIKNKSLEIEDIENKMKGVTGISYDEKISSSSNNKSPQEKMIYKYLAYKEELQENINELTEHKKQAMSLIDKIENAEYIDVLYKRYFQYMKWEQIAVDMNYTYRGILKIHGKALQIFDKVLKSVHTSSHLDMIK